MALKTGDEYLKSIKSLGLKAHLLGVKTGDLPEHGLVKPSQRAAAFTFDCAHNPETRELFCVESRLFVSKRFHLSKELLLIIWPPGVRSLWVQCPSSFIIIMLSTF